MLRIYLTDLSAYNKGFLHGEWLTLPIEEDELSEAINKILKAGEALCFIEEGYYEKHEEYFITDYEFEDEIELFDVGEYSDPFRLNSELNLIEEHGAKDSLKELSFLLTQGYATDIEDALTKLDDVILHENQTMPQLAQNLIDELYNLNSIPSIIANHIDYEAIARQLEIEGNYTVINDDILEYRN